MGCNKGGSDGIVPGDADKFGPDCVNDDYLDKNGCPSDLIPSSGGFWSKFGFGKFLQKNAAQKKPVRRFQLWKDPKTEKEQCVDFTDCICHCKGDGYTFKSHETTVNPTKEFTGYGYFANGKWTAFSGTTGPTATGVRSTSALTNSEA